MGDSAHDYVIAHLPGLLPRLWRFGLVLSHDRDMAEELVQMTCVRAIERAQQFTPGTRFDRWLFRSFIRYGSTSCARAGLAQARAWSPRKRFWLPMVSVR